MTKDKWHPDNVTWPGIPTHPSYLTRPGPDAAGNVSMEMGEGYSVVPAEAYRELYEQREKELAAARELREMLRNALARIDELEAERVKLVAGCRLNRSLADDAQRYAVQIEELKAQVRALKEPRFAAHEDHRQAVRIKAARELADAVEAEVFKHVEPGRPRWAWMWEPPDADSMGDALAAFREVDK